MMYRLMSVKCKLTMQNHAKSLLAEQSMRFNHTIISEKHSKTLHKFTTLALQIINVDIEL